MTQMLKQPLPLFFKIVVVLIMLCGAGAVYNIVSVNTPVSTFEAILAFLGMISIPIGITILLSENVVREKPQKPEAYQSAPNA